MKRLMVATLVAGFACSTAKKPVQAVQPASPPPTAPMHAPVAAAPAAPDPLGPEVVLDELHALDGQLIEASKLAEKSAHDRRVKKLAKSLVSARTQADTELLAMATKLSVTLKDPAQLALSPADKAALAANHEALAGLSTKAGPGFDYSYLTSLDTALKGELGLLSQVDAKSTNADLKSLSAKLEPVVAGHEKSAARDLKSEGHKSAG